MKVVFESRRPSHVFATNIYTLAKEEAIRKEERKYLSVNKINPHFPGEFQINSNPSLLPNLNKQGSTATSIDSSN